MSNSINNVDQAYDNDGSSQTHQKQEQAVSIESPLQPDGSDASLSGGRITTEIDVADVQETRLSGFTGGILAIVSVKGDVLLSVDLDQGPLESVDHKTRTATLVLPPPKVRSPRLDQDRTRLVMLSAYGIWTIVPGDLASTHVVNEAYQQAQDRAASVALQPKILRRSQRQAESVVQCMFKMIGWDVRVRWEEHAIER